MEAISHDIRKCTNFVPSRVSKAAFEEASNLGVDLRQMDWHDQTRFNPGRCKFHREHMVLVKTIRDECCGAITDDEVLETLLTKPRVVWILKSEDAELTRLGYRSKRDDSLAAYQNAGIELLE